ncbi:hypothetical protein BDF20DRAFT_916783 [Mycotypha africana]|uniref:uncharacterized protein n=1 Tax=Mycotypha africana TaxID=64632 RepID=UPI002301B0F9|nr:uncharacterized protein BDF20DRAFT_916783 [Mycotypha africana]KAI8968230.1 hypothetical protein BDF20DRAFT_916783 [Mycotypha africana]
MPQTVILALGYLTFPLFVRKTVKCTDEKENALDEATTAATDVDQHSKVSAPRWSLGSIISITSFLKDPLSQYPTLEKHVLQLASDAYPHERETSFLLSKAMNKISNEMDNKKSISALIILKDDCWGIFSVTEEPDIYTLQVIQPPADEARLLLESNPIGLNNLSAPPSAVADLNNNTSDSSNDGYPEQLTKSFVLDEDQLVKPAEMMRLCQLGPPSQPQLIQLAGQVYDIATLYGYWGYWRVFEGICNNYQLNASQLVNLYHQQQLPK